MLTKIRSFLRLPFNIKLFVLELCSFLTLAKAAIVLLPFSFISKYILTKRLGKPYTKDIEQKYNTLHKTTAYTYELSQYLPWKSLCLDQALAARWMLHRRKITTKLYFGVMLDHTIHKKVKAHAWLMVGEHCVTGHGYESYRIINEY